MIQWTSVGCKEDIHGNLINWKTSSWKLSRLNETRLHKNVDKGTICHVPELKRIELMYALTYNEAVSVCKALGSELSVLGDNTTIAAVENGTTLGDHFYWAGFDDSKKDGQFISQEGVDFGLDRWYPGEPNGKHYQNCLLLFVSNGKGTFKDEDCESKSKFFCNVVKPVALEARGQLTSKMEHNYYYDGTSNIFFGPKKTLIIYKEKRWIMVDRNDNVIADLNYHSLPLGNHPWMLNETKSEIKINLNSCDMNKFPCSDGSCVDESARCNLHPDCPMNDASDEMNCQTVDSLQGQVENAAPRDISGSLLNVTVDLSIISLLDIDLAGNTINLKLHIQTLWRDSRLTFNNLKKGIENNSLNHEEWKKIWTPVLYFLNTKEVLATDDIESDSSSIVLVHKTGTSDPTPAHFPSKNFVTKGEDAEISKQSYYSLQFICQYLVQYYPFDIQECLINMEIYGKDKAMVNLQPGKANIENKRFMDYAIRTITFNTEPVLRDIGNYSRLICKLTITRDTRQAILKVFMPTIIMCYINLMTNYFLGHDMFEGVISVNASILMTMASLFVTSSTMLPPSAQITYGQII